MTPKERFETREANYNATAESELKNVRDEKRKHLELLEREGNNMSYVKTAEWIEKMRNLREYEDFLKSLLSLV